MDGDRIVANIYRHFDGYPESMLPDLQSFFKEVKDNLPDTRFTDAEYLAAKYVTWQAKQNATKYNSETGKHLPADHFLDFLSLGVCIQDHGDIEYIYEVNSDRSTFDESGLPGVRWKGMYRNSRWQEGLQVAS